MIRRGMTSDVRRDVSHGYSTSDYFECLSRDIRGESGVTLGLVLGPL